MKRYILTICCLFLLLGFFSIPETVNSQEIKSEKEIRKEARKAEMIKEFLAMESMIENRKFVLRIEQELSRENIEVNPQMNFLRIDSLDCIYETEHKYYVLLRLVDENPLRGTIDKWELDKNEKRYGYDLRFKMVTRIGLFDVFMTIRSDKTATGSITLKENAYSFYGRVFAL